MYRNQPRRRLRRIELAAITLCLFAGTAFAHIQVTKSEPADGSTVDRAIRSIRIFFDQVPDLERSELALEGPEGAEVQVQGLHTMGEQDLMATVSGRMPDGDYTIKWKTAGQDGHQREGEITFTLARGR
jgi:hypothetical protein